MFPNADTLISLNTLEHQARLREAGRARVAIRAEAGRHARPTRSRAARLVPAFWLNDIAACVRAAKRQSRPLLGTSGSARNAHPVA